MKRDVPVTLKTTLQGVHGVPYPCGESIARLYRYVLEKSEIKHDKKFLMSYFRIVH